MACLWEKVAVISSFVVLIIRYHQGAGKTHLFLSLSFYLLPQLPRSAIDWGNRVIGTYWIIGSVVLTLEGLLTLL